MPEVESTSPMLLSIEQPPEAYSQFHDKADLPGKTMLEGFAEKEHLGKEITLAVLVSDALALSHLPEQDIVKLYVPRWETEVGLKIFSEPLVGFEPLQTFGSELALQEEV